MSELHPSDHKALLRAGFTEREIATQKRKFINLTQIQPCYTDELRQFDQLMQDRRALLDSLQIAVGRIKDMLRDDDGQAWKEAEKWLPKLQATIAKATGEQS